MLKPCTLKECPLIFKVGNKYHCGRSYTECKNITCRLKQFIEKSEDRCKYIDNKLSGCYGYSEEQKQFRKEEHKWLIEEFVKIFNLEVNDGNSCMGKEFLGQ